jgi:mycothiol synthase
VNELSPLRERVEAPHRLALPIHPDVARWRPLTAADAPALARLHAAADPLDHPEWAMSQTEIEARLARTSLDLARDTIAGVTDAGTVVAYGMNFIDEHPATLVRVLLAGAIHPEVRGLGLGRQLLQWQRGRAQQQLAASELALPGWILSWQSAANDSGVKLAELLGFRAVRYVATLARELAAPIDEHETDAAVRLVPWDAALSPAALDAHRAAFRDHWGAQPSSDELWRELTASPLFRAELSFLAVAADDPGTVVGYALARAGGHDVERRGHSSSHIELLGTRREWRRRGVASGLLARVLLASRAAGLQMTLLDVDVESPTGPLSLYEALGFRPTGDRRVAFVLSY